MKQPFRKAHVLTRRQALAVVAGGCLGCRQLLANPLNMLVQGVIDGIAQKAHAEATGADPAKLYFGFDVIGGFRPYFIAPLMAPYDPASSIVQHMMMANSFLPSNSANQSGKLTYAVTPLDFGNIGRINFPKLWERTLPTANGGTYPMADLAQNLLAFPFNMQTDGHTGNQRKVLWPDGSKASLAGAAADASQAPIPAVGVNMDTQNYRSAKGNSIVYAYPDGGVISRILEPYTGRNTGLNATFMSRRDAMEVTINQALASMGEYARSQAPGAESLNALGSKAEVMLRRGIGDAANVYAGLRNKYRALIATTISMPIAGVTDKPFLPNQYTAEDRSALWEGEGYLIGSTDLTRCLDGSSSFLPDIFAMAEYLLLSGYSSSVVGSLQQILGARLPPSSRPDGSNVGNSEIRGFDEHLSGPVISTIFNSIFWSAFAACTGEMIRQMKAAGVWEQSVIHVFSEFGRNPRSDARGSDHGYESSAMLVFSGMVKNPTILGDVYTNSSRGFGLWNFPSTYGEAAPVAIGGPRAKPVLGNATSTVCKLLGVPSPTPNFHSFVEFDSKGELVAATGPTRMVAK